MLSVLQSLLGALTYPPWLSLCVLVIGLIAWRSCGRRWGIGLVGSGLAWTLLWSVPWCADRLRDTLARRHPVLDAAAIPHADAIVVLGGGRYAGWMRRESVEPDDLPSSRLATGARAWLAGRAPLIVLTGGLAGPGPTEASLMATAILKTGIPRSALLLETRSTSTRDNARLTAALLRERELHRILLVTSAVHMPRAVLAFREEGLEVVPVPAAEPDAAKGWVDTWLPTRRALWRSGRALKEYAALSAIAARQAWHRPDASTQARQGMGAHGSAP